MGKKLVVIAAFITCCASFINAQAGGKIKISSGGTSSSTLAVRSIGIGSQIPRRRKSPAARSQRYTPSIAIIQAPGISSEFKLGEVYVYPNPAKGGQVPTFHIETGLADNVKITVYSVSGDIAHTHTVIGQPNAVNDGNGLDYAYEYAWRGHIPSGVYYFLAEAQQAGKKLRKTGRFAVVR